MILNEYEKNKVVEQLIENKDIRTDYLITLNTCSKMSNSSLNQKLSLMSAVVNKKFIKGRWWKKINERIWFYCFNEVSKDGHAHSNCILRVPSIYKIEEVIEEIKSAWIYVGKYKHFISKFNNETGNFIRQQRPLNFEIDIRKHEYNTKEVMTKYQIKSYYDDTELGIGNKYFGQGNDQKFNIF
jgi:hypothetical protein